MSNIGSSLVLVEEHLEMVQQSYITLVSIAQTYMIPLRATYMELQFLNVFAKFTKKKKRDSNSRDSLTKYLSSSRI
jgi:hypothetical protein